MSRQTLKLTRRKLCIGDLKTLIKISDRRLTEPGFSETNFGEEFPDAKTAWAKVRTINGRTLFNGVDTDIALTHEISIRYDPSVTSESWIQLTDGTRLDIVDTQNLEERNEYLILLCNARGNQEASKA